MRIYGLDFSSAPGRRKPLIVLGCTLEGDSSLRVEDSETLTDFGGFESFLQRRAPGCARWTSRSANQDLWKPPLGGEVGILPKEEFEDKIRADMAKRPAGSK